MIDNKQVNKIKNSVEDFFNKMTISVLGIEVETENSPEEKDVVRLNVKLDEPQILIGQGGQTLFELQRILRMILNKKLETIFYLNLDINDYKKKKVEYIKSSAKELADEVALTKIEKALPPMSAYERRAVHAELAQRTDITTESQGEGSERHIVIKAN
jgi:spoIIIJ-associated protein